MHQANDPDRPFLVKRTSDLLGKYEGETERSIAGAFDQAEIEEGAVYPSFDEGWEFSSAGAFVGKSEKPGKGQQITVRARGKGQGPRR